MREMFPGLAELQSITRKNELSETDREAAKKILRRWPTIAYEALSR